MEFGFITVPSITAICFLMGMVIKASALQSKWIPSICGALGAVLGLAGYFIIPELIASDPFSAIAVGIASGLAATGAHQIYVEAKEG
ncbi:MAG: phage holin family protein [Peptococcaceae bacterium]|nr:phage holin family protein [Peptococcaceae bacterium]